MASNHHTESTEALLRETFAALDLPDTTLDRLRVVGEEHLASCFAVTDLAVASIGAAGASVAEIETAITDAGGCAAELRASEA